MDDAGVANGGMDNESAEARLHTEMNEANIMPSEAKQTR